MTLAPCNRCGGDSPAIVNALEGGFYVRCNRCGNKTDIVQTPRLARQAWREDHSAAPWPTVSFRLPQAIYVQLKATADAEGVCPSVLIRDAIREKLTAMHHARVGGAQ